MKKGFSYAVDFRANQVTITKKFEEQASQWDSDENKLMKEFLASAFPCSWHAFREEHLSIPSTKYYKRYCNRCRGPYAAPASPVLH